MGFSTSPGTQPNLGASSISGHPVESSFTLPLEPGLGLVLSLLVLHMLGLLLPRMAVCPSSSMSFWGLCQGATHQQYLPEHFDPSCMGSEMRIPYNSRLHPKPFVDNPGLQIQLCRVIWHALVGWVTAGGSG